MAWAREPSPILGKRRWERRALALPWPRAQVIDIDVGTTGIRQPRKLKRKYGIADLELHQRDRPAGGSTRCGERAVQGALVV